MSEKPSSNRNALIIGSVGVLIAVAITVAILVGTDDTNSNNSVNTSISSQISSPQEMTEYAKNSSQEENNNMEVAEETAYKDGNYEIEVEYDSPGGLDKIKVNLTLQNSTATELSIIEMPGNEVSKGYQEAFSEGIQSEVVGKDLDEIDLEVVSGASLTTNAFKEALTQIKDQAK